MVSGSRAGAGYWYGSPVNFANRITDVAHPGMVWVAEPTRHAIGSDSEFNFSALGERTLKGVSTRLAIPPESC